MGQQSGFGTVVGYPGLGSSAAYASSPITFGTQAYQANLPALGTPVAATPQYQSVVAQQSGYTIPTTINTQTVTAGLPTAQSMVAYPGVSAMEGPFKFTAGATYQSGLHQLQLLPQLLRQPPLPARRRKRRRRRAAAPKSQAVAKE